MDELMRVIAIDPGPVESGWVVISQTGIVIHSGKTPNGNLHKRINKLFLTHGVVEEAICRKWAGRDVSDTAFVAGRFHYQLEDKLDGNVMLINRSKVRWHITGVKQANDSRIIDCLVKRFQPKTFKKYVEGEIGRNKMLAKARHDYFNGFVADMWQAYALAITFLDMYQGKVRG